MQLASIRSGISLILCVLLTGSGVSAQDGKKAKQTMQDSHELIKPDPKQAKKLVEAGEELESEGRLDKALDAYEEAARYAPFDVNIANKGATLRNKLVLSHIEEAETYTADGNFQDATVQLAAALRIDPNNKAVMQRMKQLASMSEGRQTRAYVEEPPKGLVKADPSKTTANFNARTDLRSAYEQVAAAYGLKVIFDPDLPTRNVRLNLQGVDFDTAMKVLTMETATFWKAVNPKLLFVAADTTEKRRLYDPQIEQTFLLPAAVDSSEITEIVRVVRELTGIQRIQQSVANHSLTVRDSVQKVQLAGAIINDIEQARGEVLLEIDLLEVDRTTARNLGITWPASLKLYSIPSNIESQLRSQPDLTSLLTLLTQIFGTAASGGLTSLAAAIPPLAAIGGGKSTFLLGLPTFTANFSDMLSLVHSGRQILLRAQDSKPATFFVGDRVPITLSLLSGSLGANPTQTPNPGGTGFTINSQQFTVGAGPVSLVSADFRQTGQQDLAVLNELDNSVTILLNQGSSAATTGATVTQQFAQATNSPISLGTPRTTAPAIPAQIATGNLNPLATGRNPISGGDNLPDLLVTDPVGNTVTVLLAGPAADGTFLTPQSPVAVGKTPSGIVTGTFNTNSDANTGFVVTNFADNTYSVWLGNGDGTFQQAPNSPFKLPATELGPYAITAGDFNGDGKTDLAILNQTTTNVAVLGGNGDGTFTEFPQSPYPVGKIPVAIASGALSGSTNPALAIVNQSDNSVTLYLGNGDGTFLAAQQSPLATDTTPTGIAIADFAGQGTGGFAVTNTAAGTVTVYADLGNGLFEAALEPGAGTNPGAIAAGDFTGQSFPDVVVANNNNQVGVAGVVTLIVSPASVVAGSSIGQTPYPGAEYEDIGLKVKATPNLHANGDVTVQFDFDIKSLAGTNLNGIPIITNRVLQQVVRLKENETSLIGGLLDRQATKTITGIPGLVDIPGLNYVFGSHNDTSQDTDFLILVTPRQIRLPVHEARTIYAGRGEPGTSRIGSGAIAPPPAAPPENQPAPGTPPPAGAAPAGTSPGGTPPPNGEQQNPAAAPPPQQQNPAPEQPQPETPTPPAPTQENPPEHPQP
jgi:type II secretory pathway component GspD/PulD (secretin)